MRDVFGGLIGLLILIGAIYSGLAGYQAGGWIPAALSFFFILIVGAIGLSLFDLIWRIFSRLSRL